MYEIELGHYFKGHSKFTFFQLIIDKKIIKLHRKNLLLGLKSCHILIGINSFNMGAKMAKLKLVFKTLRRHYGMRTLPITVPAVNR